MNKVICKVEYDTEVSEVVAKFTSGEIGDAAGRNWWCVIFPNLCISSAADSSWFEENNLQILQTSPQFEPRFALLEWVERFRTQND